MKLATNSSRFRTVAIAVIVVVLFMLSRLLKGPLLFADVPVTHRPNPHRLDLDDSCAHQLNTGRWTDRLEYSKLDNLIARRYEFSSEAKDCGAQFWNMTSAKPVLQGKTILFTGDSVARNLFSALLAFAGASPITTEKSHEDFYRYLPNLEAEAYFFWQAYPTNLTDQLKTVPLNDRPHIIIVSVSLWHMLHMNSAVDFQRDLIDLQSVLANRFKVSTRIFVTAPETFPDKMSSSTKKSNMSPMQVDEYNSVLDSLLTPQGACVPLDLQALTWSCGEECSVDGVHSNKEVYLSALQIIISQANKV